jgi:hypothetical protein
MAGKRRFGSENTRTAARTKVDLATRILPEEVAKVPDSAIQVLSIDDERERANVLKAEIVDLKTLTAELVSLRERANVQGRITNLQLIEKIDSFLTNMMDMLTTDEMNQRMEQAMFKALEKGDVKQVKELMVAIGIALDKKNAMIEGSGFTDGKKKNVKIAVNFANDGSTQVGVNVN